MVKRFPSFCQDCTAFPLFNFHCETKHKSWNVVGEGLYLEVVLNFLAKSSKKNSFVTQFFFVFTQTFQFLFRDYHKFTLLLVYDKFLAARQYVIPADNFHFFNHLS